MEWTYCLECGAPQFPGDADCPQCCAAAKSGETETLEVPTSPTMAWVGVLQSIWIAQLLAAAGGLLLALVVGFGLGYASRVINRPASADSARPSVPVKVQPTAAAGHTEPGQAASPPALVTAAELPHAEPATKSEGPQALVGPPRTLMGPPAELADLGWELEGMRPPPEHWLNLRVPNSRSTPSPLSVYEPLSPSVQLYGRHLPGATTIRVQWQIPTPQEWQGAMFGPSAE